jgi:predicted dinucleotide-binding enzyme
VTSKECSILEHVSRQKNIVEPSRRENSKPLFSERTLRSLRRAALKEYLLKIGIIGAGNIGGALTRRLTSLGHNVLVTNARGPKSLANLAAETGAVPVPIIEIAQDVDMVIVSIPMKSIPSLPTGVIDVLPAGVVIIDTNNYAPKQRDGKIEEIENGMTESRWA